MKKTKLIILILICILTTGCSNIKTINYKTLKQKLDNKETFILETARTKCSHCKDFTPRFNKILKDNNLKAYKIYLDRLTSKQKVEFNSIMYINGTPTVVFIKNGKETGAYDRIIGAVSNKKIINKLKELGYI